ncbi:(2Fe-2S)-binding protein [Undibacterium sp. RTI2.1]|uniref:(2Fe-2S)-binding protein n=1 Tax=unclassified Undibacterium TaxID=2630295 RepID=UPI002AB4C5D7|nr:MULTISPECIES: (2Fe-2S)-binding protein [unclassified Undibacterium]MDY7538832.1 (2Fe-2S)-binding protein [Undibacterium sp. 5I1]MEB0031976.1 (2Fe-2S)-binding protein [Undibacterium sp. RTI2.1]MEB0118185.1 (2Fe-2S)-binding protein [Undibacterium sp. RTI2.2]MEB0231825.1 (2Fe-2S)-binding protein [Undibacterium sp. 10I3]MEB0258911.1 (2Fe-2S)-binding protein [Undibacterium sp. 5I1]
MIVCVCNNVSEKKVRNAVAAGLTTMSELRTHLDVGTCCGKCASCARSILRECQSSGVVSSINKAQQPHPIRFQPQALAA